MQIYETYCREEVDPQGRLTGFRVDYPDDFNFGYDVVDAAARKEPGKRAMVWCNGEGEERIFTFRDISLLSNRVANVFLSAGIRRGDKVMVILKRH